MSKIEKRFTGDCARYIREQIEESEGREVLFCGRINEDKIISRITPAARGDYNSVPILFPHIKEGDIVIHNHPSGNLTPSKPDLSAAGFLAEDGYGFYIINNDVSDVYVVCEPIVLKQRLDLDHQKLLGALEPGGSVSRHIIDYEPREQQIAMMEKVIDSFNENKVAVVEAGTGVGKSFAYIIPALKWASQNSERVVISTATINLQQQLHEKDIPMLQKIMRSDIKVVLVKGRRNYICLKRLEEYSQEDALFREPDDETTRIHEWLETTPTGSRDDLPFMPDGLMWSRICGEADLCTWFRCPRFENCFIQRNRKEASTAGVLVVNHHLLFADLSARMSGMGYENTAVLPPYKKVIFDEAHNTEKSATSFFSSIYNRLSLSKYLNILYRKKKGRVFGALSQLQQLCPDQDLFERIPSMVREIHNRADSLEIKIQNYFPEGYHLRFKGPPDTFFSEQVKLPLDELALSIRKLTTEISLWLDKLGDDPQDKTVKSENQLILTKLVNTSQFAEEYSRYDDDPENVYWLERKRSASDDNFFQLNKTPLNISRIMNEAVLSAFETVLFTSATLSVNKTFQFWGSRNGLFLQDRSRIIESSQNSPFPYRENVFLGVPVDGPQPENSPDFYRYLIDTISVLVEINEGKALILFTSFTMLNETAAGLVSPMKEQGINVLIQGKDSKQRLLERFREDTNSILLATDSFWEGVDVPGEALSLVVICRLPFRVPSDPVIKARMEDIEARNGNSFMDYSLPEAVMRFKQGFGRLMRKHSDRGSVIILDPRIIGKYYGRYFLNSLPETQRSFKNLDSMLIDYENFLGNG